MTRRGTVASTEGMQVGQPDAVILTDGTLDTGGAKIEPVEPRGLNDDYMDELAFMEEDIVINIQESPDENADNPVMVGVNGVFKAIYRGQDTIIKRKFVDALIVKMTRISTPEFINAAGERARKIDQRQALRYPFTLVEDKNPKGIEWMRRRMADVV